VTLTQVEPSALLKIHLLIVDQQRTFRDALAIRLRAEPDLMVAAHAQSTESARRVQAGRSTDVILLDAELPDNSSVAFCAEMTRRVPAPRVVMLSAASEAQRIVATVRAGAVAWVRKDESVDYLLCVIRRVVRGETWLPPAALGQVLRLLIDDQDDRCGSDELLAALTPRERDVLFYLLEGAGCKEVAMRLRLSPNTVRSHLQSLMAKFEVHSTLELVALTRHRLEALREDRQLRTSAMSPGAGLSGPSRTGRGPVPAQRRDTAGVVEEAAAGAVESLVPGATRALPFGTAGTRLPSQSE
jgi:DNA-binding NarL/FixJ family response regulator